MSIAFSEGINNDTINRFFYFFSFSHFYESKRQYILDVSFRIKWKTRRIAKFLLTHFTLFDGSCVMIIQNESHDAKSL